MAATTEPAGRPSPAGRAPSGRRRRHPAQAARIGALGAGATATLGIAAGLVWASRSPEPTPVLAGATPPITAAAATPVAPTVPDAAATTTGDPLRLPIHLEPAPSAQVRPSSPGASPGRVPSPAPAASESPSAPTPTPTAPPATAPAPSPTTPSSSTHGSR